MDPEWNNGVTKVQFGTKRSISPLKTDDDDKNTIAQACEHTLAQGCNASPASLFEQLV